MDKHDLVAAMVMLGLFVPAAAGEKDAPNVVVIEAEEMTLSGPKVVELAGAGKGKAITFAAEGDEATASLPLEAGHWQVRVYMKGADPEHDSVWLHVGQEQWNQYPGSCASLATAELPARFSLKADATVTVRLKTKETNVLVDRLEIRPQPYRHVVVERKTAEPPSLPPPADWRLDFLLYLPPGYDKSTKKWPLLVQLGGIGTDLNRNGMVFVPPEKMQADFPFIVAIPQNPKSSWYHYTKPIANLLDALIANYRVDPGRVYLTGYSLGGGGALFIASQLADRIAAVAALSGSTCPDKAPILKDVPVWLFCGADDGLVKWSDKMAAALKEHKGNCRYTRIPGAGHAIADLVYGDPKLYEWFAEQSLRARPAARVRLGDEKEGAVPAPPLARRTREDVLALLAQLPKNGDKQRILLGQFGAVTKGGPGGDYEEIARRYGKPPAVYHWEAQWLFGAPAKHFVDESKKAWDAGALVTVGWTPKTPPRPGTTIADVDRENAKRDPEAFRVFWDDWMARTAGHLAELRDHGVVVLFRPFHGPEWRKWIAAAPKALVRVWRQVHRHFTRDKKLDKLLWVFADTRYRPEFYPGDHYVDVVGVDLYKVPPYKKDDFAEVEKFRRAWPDKPLVLAECGTAAGDDKPMDRADAMAFLQAIKKYAPDVRYRSWWSLSGDADHKWALYTARNAEVYLRDPWIVTRDEMPALWRSIQTTKRP